MDNINIAKPAISAIKAFERHSFCQGQSLRNNKIVDSGTTSISVYLIYPVDLDNNYITNCKFILEKFFIHKKKQAFL